MNLAQLKKKEERNREADEISIAKCQVLSITTKRNSFNMITIFIDKTQKSQICLIPWNSDYGQSNAEDTSCQNYV